MIFLFILKYISKFYYQNSFFNCLNLILLNIYDKLLNIYDKLLKYKLIIIIFKFI